MQLERLTDAQAVAVRCADLLAEILRAKPEAVLLLPAGATPVPFYAELVRRACAKTFDLGRAHLFQLDELLRDKLRGSGLEPYVEIVATIQGETEKKPIEVFRV